MKTLNFKRFVAAALLAAALCASAEAQVKITELPSATPATSDIVPFVSMSGTPTTKRTTVADLLAGLTFTAPLSRTGSTVSISAANGSTNGYLTAADWATFNAKQAALGFSPLNPSNNLADLGSASAARTNLGLGTAAVLNAPSSGNAVSGELVKGDDTRLTNARTPTGGAGGVLSGSYPSPGFAVDMAEQGELDAHASNTSNPHSVTKAQVGLASVTDAAQLKIASNLSDLASASTARTNLGLGSASTASSSDFAAASHAHAFSEVTGTAANSQLPATLSSKTFDNTNTANFKGTLFTLQDATDTTKQARFDLSNVTAGQTRSVNIPDAASTTVQAKSATATQFLTAMSAQGVFSAAQPAFSDLSGSATDAQIPNSITVDLATAASTANAGDSATNFFPSGTIEPARLLTGTVTNSRCVRVNSSGQLETHSADCGAGGGGGSLSFTSMTLSGTWANWGGSYSTAAYTKTSEGLVILRGMITGGATTAGSLITTLPSGFRPAADQIYVIQHGGSFGYVILHADGTLTAEDYSNATWSLSLDTIRFVAEQ